jgi:hypothetical protein
MAEQMGFGFDEPTDEEKARAAADKKKRNKEIAEVEAKKTQNESTAKKAPQSPILSPAGNVYKNAASSPPTEEDIARAQQRTKLHEAEKAKEKAKTYGVSDEYFKDKRTPKSDLIRQAEIEKMKEIVNKPKGGGGGGSGGVKSMKYEPKSYKSGGKVSSASARADGIATKGKTRGRIV